MYTGYGDTRRYSSTALLSHLIFLLLITLAIWLSFHPLPLFIGVTVSGVKLILFLLLGWFGLGHSLAAGAVVYGAAYGLNQMELIPTLMNLLELSCISLLVHRRPYSMITSTAAYWAIVGSPILLGLQLLTLGSINTYSLLQLQIYICISLFSAILADLLVAYAPVRIYPTVSLRWSNSLSFRRLMVHLALSVLLLPFLLYTLLSIRTEEAETFISIRNQFQYERTQLEKAAAGLSDNQILALNLNSSLQKKLLDQELQRVMGESQSDLILMNTNGGLLYATFPIESRTYNWQGGGEIIKRPSGLEIWLPYGSYTSPLLRWNDAYVVTELELPLRNRDTLAAVLMVPFSTYLANLVSPLQSQLWVILIICGSVMILSLLFHLIFFKPLNRLAETTTSIPEKIASGLQIEWLRSRLWEITALAGNFRVVSEQLEDMFAQAKMNNNKLQEQKERLEASESQLHRLAFYDPLTGLPNRLYFKSFSEQLLEDAKLKSHPDNRFALLFIDLDRFKQVNDTYGHDVGDGLLQQFARHLPQDLEYEERCLSFRISGDEFVVMMAIQELEEAAYAAEQLQQALTEPIQVGDVTLNASCSIGIALYPEHGHDMDVLIKHADTAMYEAKLRGRNQYSLYTLNTENMG